MRKIEGIPDNIMTEIDFMLGSIEECNSDHMLPILHDHGIDPNGSWLDSDTVPEEVIRDIYERLFKTGFIEPFYTVYDDEENELV